ncbi:MAG: class I SAM-dependent methyltransferase [Bacteroidales bacterium]|nr:class I SAM-dependent methyltransferase [Bacteroidales bacterium]
MKTKKKNQANNYFSVNKLLWNKRTEFHLKSDFYNNEDFINGKSSLNQIELDLLGNIQDKNILHLQCHFGQDTISLARMGAKVTGIDFSEKAIEAGIKLAQTTNTHNIEFICCDLYKLPKFLNKRFDIVFTSYGTIAWLPDINKWANIVARYLKTGGKFVFAEFHPIVWIFDNKFEKIIYNYTKSDAIIETETGTYADKKANIAVQSINWNHSLSETINSLIVNKINIEQFNEFDYSPYNCFNNTVEVAPNKFMIKGLEKKIPLTYSILGIKKLKF